MLSFQPGRQPCTIPQSPRLPPSFSKSFSKSETRFLSPSAQSGIFFLSNPELGPFSSLVTLPLRDFFLTDFVGVGTGVLHVKEPYEGPPVWSSFTENDIWQPDGNGREDVNLQCEHSEVKLPEFCLSQPNVVSLDWKNPRFGNGWKRVDKKVLKGHQLLSVFWGSCTSHKWFTGWIMCCAGLLDQRGVLL